MKPPIERPGLNSSHLESPSLPVRVQPSHRQRNAGLQEVVMNGEATSYGRFCLPEACHFVTSWLTSNLHSLRKALVATCLGSDAAKRICECEGGKGFRRGSREEGDSHIPRFLHCKILSISFGNDKYSCRACRSPLYSAVLLGALIAATASAIVLLPYLFAVSPI
jgi:hypothetical protein